LKPGGLDWDNFDDRSGRVKFFTAPGSSARCACWKQSVVQFEPTSAPSRSDLFSI
jgi:hypothetical protein